MGFAALNVLAHEICGLAKGEALFAMCCADGAASGHLGFKTCFPDGLWLQCWVHVLRKFDTKTSELAPGLPAAEKRQLRDWFKKEVKAMFRCVGQVKWKRCVAQCSVVCTIQIAWHDPNSCMSQSKLLGNTIQIVSIMTSNFITNQVGAYKSAAEFRWSREVCKLV
jgi:hypothetical protein